MYNNKRIIITMTSWTKRIKNVPKVVFSILSNTITPDSIELNLSTDEFINKEKDLPEELILLNQNGIININWVKENTGVFKKLIPTLQKYKNEDYYLISCDDDWLYNKDFIQILLTRLNEGCWYSLQNAKQVIGNSTIYRSIIFDSDFWEVITDELISIGISDYYITKYLIKKQKYQQVEKHNKIYDFAKPFNQIFPNSHNKTNGNGNYDIKRIKMAYNITDKILEKI